METVSNTISTYISTINSLFFQTTLEQTIRQSLLFSDEIIIVNSEDSSDGSQNLLDNLKSEYPNIIKLYTFKEDYTKRWDTVAEKKTCALKKCTKEYCILQDDDECIHEKYADYIKQLPSLYTDTVAFRFNTIHFYRNYNRYHPPSEDWYPGKIYMVKNIPEIKHGRVNTDPDNHIIFDNNVSKYIPIDSLTHPKVIDVPITSYHYGWCRNDAVLLMKKYFQEFIWWGKDYWKSHEFPFKFDDPNTLPEFKDTHPKYMVPIIEQEKKFNTRYIREFNKT